MTLTTHPCLPPAWGVLQQAITEKRAVRARYHGHDRVICPHALGWKNGRLTALVYQCGGATSAGDLPADPRHCWRSMHINDIENANLAPDAWKTASNYSAGSISMDSVLLTVQH